MMKVVLLSTSDVGGGAAVAARRLAEALRSQGVDARLLVLRRGSALPFVTTTGEGWLARQRAFLRLLWERGVIFLCNGFSRHRLWQVSLADRGLDLARHPLLQQADIIHIHWTQHGLLSLSGLERILALGKPVVWTLHDMWPVTAICHHAWGCTRFRQECGRCPFLSSSCEKDLSRRVFRIKRRILHTSPAPLRFVAVSQWMRRMALGSALLPKGNDVAVIGNVIDTTLFTPTARSVARIALSLPEDKKILLMGAARLDDPVKGFDLLEKALQGLPEKERGDYLLVLFGLWKGDASPLDALPVECRHIGLVSSPEKLALLYSAANATLVPSRYETFGQTIIESQACGCLPVSFDGGGQADIISHMKNGYLAPQGDTSSFLQGLRWAAACPAAAPERAEAIASARARYSHEAIARQYMDVYGRF